MIKIALVALILIISNGVAFGKDQKHNIALLSSASIFKPLIADPKWPRFSLAYQYHRSGNFGRHVFAPNMGAVLPLIRNSIKANTTYELSVHGGLFAIMDVGSKPTRLINADYFIGPALAIKKDQLDFLIRVSHTSSHLGDEFMLSQQGKNINRINLSYEVAEGIIAYNTTHHWRPFIGSGYTIHAEPSDFRSAHVIVGLDYRADDEAMLDGYVKPVFGIYSKASKNSKWQPSLSIKCGLEVKDKIVIAKTMQILLEYYTGNSVHGQFYGQKENYVGTSLNVNF